MAHAGRTSFDSTAIIAKSRFIIGKACLELKNFERAVENLKRVLDLEPTNSAAARCLQEAREGIKEEKKVQRQVWTGVLNSKSCLDSTSISSKAAATTTTTPDKETLYQQRKPPPHHQDTIHKAYVTADIFNRLCQLSGIDRNMLLMTVGAVGLVLTVVVGHIYGLGPMS